MKQLNYVNIYVPSHHWLECWGDAEPQAGYFSVIQPIIHPLFKTSQFETSLLKLTGNRMITKLISEIIGLLNWEVLRILRNFCRMV